MSSLNGLVDVVVESPVTFDPATERRVNNEIRRTTESKLRTIAYYETYIKEARVAVETMEATVRARYAKRLVAMTRLREAGFVVEGNDWDADLVVETTENRLKDVYAAIGRLDPQSVVKEPVGASRSVVRVSIQSVHFPMVTIRYIRKLTKVDKCRVKTVVSRERRIVCDR